MTLPLAGYWAQRRQKVKPPLDSYTVRLLTGNFPTLRAATSHPR